MWVAAFLEAVALASTAVNVIAVRGLLASDFLSRSSSLLFLSIMLVNGFGSSVFVVLVGPNFLHEALIFPDFVYVFIDAVSCVQWNLTAGLTATMAIERLLTLVFPRKADTLLQAGPVLTTIALQVIVTLLGWRIFCSVDFQPKTLINPRTLKSSFPRGFDFNNPSVCGTVGLGIDVVVTILCAICYMAIYVKLRRLNSVSSCALSERDVYKRRQKELRIATEYAISSSVYIGCWVTTRIIRPVLEDIPENEVFLGASLFIQQLFATITGLFALALLKKNGALPQVITCICRTLSPPEARSTRTSWTSSSYVTR